MGVVLIKLGAIKMGVGPLLAVALGALGAAPPRDSSPDRSWAGVRHILVVAHLTTDRIVVPGLDSTILCQRVKAIASAGAPAPVSCAELGDPRLQAQDNAVLIFQGAVSNALPGRQLVIFTIRRTATLGLEPGPIYFGSTPRAVPYSSSADDRLLDGAIRSSLGEILPWLNDFKSNQGLIKTGEK